MDDLDDILLFKKTRWIRFEVDDRKNVQVSVGIYLLEEQACTCLDGMAVLDCIPLIGEGDGGKFGENQGEIGLEIGGFHIGIQ
ncbi:hypothetical protein DSECCO2_549760 [anaerobic digester metagenome]